MHKLLDLKRFEDDRGVLTKVFTNTFLKENAIDSIKESYLITFNEKDMVRGKHFHEKTIEIFHVLQGICIKDKFQMTYKNIDDDKFDEVVQYIEFLKKNPS